MCRSWAFMTVDWAIHTFLPAWRSKCGTCDGNVAGWYCIKMAKPVLKLFWPSGSSIILVSSDRCADTQFQGYNPLYVCIAPFSGGYTLHGGSTSWCYQANAPSEFPFTFDQVMYLVKFLFPYIFLLSLKHVHKK